MSTFIDPQDEIDELLHRVNELENCINDLEASASTLETENNNLKTEIEEINEKHKEKVSNLLDEINGKHSETFNIFYELYVSPLIEKLESKELPAIEVFEESVNHHIFCDLINETMEMNLGFFHEDEDESILKNSYSLACEGIQRLLKEINSVIDSESYFEFINELCKHVSLCPTNILAFLNEYTCGNITCDFVQSLPEKVKNSLARSLMSNFYVSRSYIPNTMMNSITSYSVGMPYTSAIKELFVVLWDHLNQDKLKVKMKDHSDVASKINAVVNYKKGYRKSTGKTRGLLEDIMDRDISVSDDFWETYFTKNQESFKSFYKHIVSKEDGSDYIEKIPSSIRKEVNKLKIKGDF